MLHHLAVKTAPGCLVRTLQGANSGNMRRRPMRERVRPDRPNAGVPASRDHERPRRHRVPGTESTALHRHPENRRTTPCCGNKWFYRLIATYIADCPVTPTRTSIAKKYPFDTTAYGFTKAKNHEKYHLAASRIPWASLSTRCPMTICCVHRVQRSWNGINQP